MAHGTNASIDSVSASTGSASTGLRSLGSAIALSSLGLSLWLAAPMASQAKAIQAQTAPLAVPVATPLNSQSTSAPLSAQPAPGSQLSEAPQPSPAIEQLADGVYLYGESPERDQLGKGYFVFDIQRGVVQGALYMPRSSFDCTYGKLQNNQLALTVINSYDRQDNPFVIALEQTSTVASIGRVMPPQPATLKGFHRIAELSDRDRSILATCKADLQRKH